MEEALQSPSVEKSPFNVKSWIAFAARYQNPLIFVGGFLFDAVTLQRIDSWLDLLWQFSYLTALTVLLIYQYRERRGHWKPTGFVAKVWHYNVEALHFMYGGLLSPYTIFYFKSASGTRPIIFFLLIVALLFLNEMPQIRKMGHRLRLGLYAFCVCSFLIYLVPILAGRMGGWIFTLSMLISAWIVWRIAGRLAIFDEDFNAARLRLYTPAAAVLIIIAGLYALRLIPPVPLSVQYNGIFHGVEKHGDRYELKALKQPFYLFWRRESRPFRARPGDSIVYFARVFAPSRFHHRVMMRWEYFDPAKDDYVTSDLIPLNLSGGRGEGFRGYAVKSNFTEGRWRVSTETEDGRPISILKFSVVADPPDHERVWRNVTF